ncbi:HTH-type sugar sensing transcriptional regulator TrmBL1 [uncultured archaeon]|nr:HTH-type sugar sensing transcriptional regulator TrmBL1 [uncultured archaeon]
MEEKIIETLKSIGLSSSEVVIYLDLLANNNSLAREISKRTHIHKANVYETLKKLVLKGFVKEILKEETRYFFAFEPKILLDYLKEKERALQEIIPDLPLASIHREEDGEPEISIHRGIIAARVEIMNLLEMCSEILVYGIPKSAMEIFGTWFLDDFHKKRIKKKVKLRQIFDENIPQRFHKLNKLPYTEVKYSGLKQSTPIFIGICGETVITLILTNPITTIKIKNKDIASNYREYFELVWQRA